MTATKALGITPEQVARVKAIRRELRRRQKPQRCKKHPDAPSRLFAVQAPGRRVRHVWLCVECALTHVVLGHDLRQP